MYELLVLTLLMRYPWHAYVIAKIANQVIGPWEQVSRGTLSTLLQKMAKDVLIVPVDPASAPFATDRPSQAYAITPAGQKRFFALMLDTTSNLGGYRRLFHIKVLNLEYLSLSQRRMLVEHYVGYCQHGLQFQLAETEEFRENRAKQEFAGTSFYEAALDVMQLNIEQWRLELDWARHLQARVAAESAESSESS